MSSPRMLSGRHFPLRTHLLILVIGTVLPALFVAAALVRRVVNDNRAAVERGLIETARGQAAVVDRELSGTIRALQGLAQSDRLTEGQLSSFRVQAERLQHEQPMWSAVILSRPNGEQIINTAAPADAPLPADAAPVAGVIATRQPVIGNVRVGQVIQQPGFPAQVPVIRNDQVTYVLSALITSAAFSDVLRREAPLSDEWVRGVVDADGVVVARSRDPERFVGQKGTPAFLERYASTDEGVYRDTALDGTAVDGAFSRAPYSRWIAGVAVPSAVVDRAFNQSMGALAIIGLALLGAGGMAAFVIARRITHDISDVANAAEALSRGKRARVPPSAVTEMRQLSNALDRSGALLEMHERERNDEMTRTDLARREAESADRAKDDFLAMLGHELRNPLAPALTALQLVRHRHRDVATRELEIIERQIQHMARLVDDLLDVSRLRRGVIALRHETFNLADVVDRAAEMTAPIYSERRHELAIHLPEDAAINGDPVRIEQIFVNLLANAAKYTEPGGHIALNGRFEGETIVVECQDDGIGMAPELISRVFELFVQGERGLDRRQGGLGLGLSVARSLVERHGGTIGAESAGLGKGSTFTVRLPRATARAKAHSASGSSRDVAAHPARVLVVDDNRDALDMLVAALRHAGFDATGALDGVEALAFTGTLQPHVAILDIGLPSMDGFHLAHGLRRSVPSLRLVALTGYGQDQDRAAARDAGFEMFFIKPTSIATLVDAINQLVAPTTAG